MDLPTNRRHRGGRAAFTCDGADTFRVWIRLSAALANYRVESRGGYRAAEQRKHASFPPSWFWELRPGASVPNCAGERINDAGFRGRPYPEARQLGRLRVVTLGDSSTFGMGVCAGQTYSAILERSLPESQVLNFGVIGFSAFQGAKLFAGRARQYRPDIVLAAEPLTNSFQPLTMTWMANSPLHRGFLQQRSCGMTGCRACEWFNS